MAVSGGVIALFSLATFIFAGWCFVWLLHILAISYGFIKLYRDNHAPLPPETPLPGVSIIKPLVGVDSNLFSNLETFFNINYPKFELLFCIDDDSDPSVMLVNRLREKYPNVAAQVFIGGKCVGVNPKINNMTPAYEAAQYELFMISDSAIRMKENYLLDMVQHMHPDVGIVQQMPTVADRKGFGSLVEKVYFCTSFARTYLTADALGINCCAGMSVIYRRDVLDQMGGLQAFAHYLAEDHFIAQAFLDRGYKVTISCFPAIQNSGSYSLDTYQKRMQRWAKLRAAMIPFLPVLEFLQECFLIGLLASWAVYFLFDWSPLAFYFVHILVWFSLDYTLLNIIQHAPLPFSKLDYIIAWFTRECLTYSILSTALVRPVIEWKNGRRFKLRWGGVADEVGGGGGGSSGGVSEKLSVSGGGGGGGTLSTSRSFTLQSLQLPSQLLQLHHSRCSSHASSNIHVSAASPSSSASALPPTSLQSPAAPLLQLSAAAAVSS